MEKVIVMTFENNFGKKISLKIRDIVDSPEADVLNGIMDIIVEKGLFLATGGPVTKKIKCELISTEVVAYEI